MAQPATAQPSASSVTLLASPTPATYGQVVTITATVTPGATGKVTFYDGVTPLGIAMISGSQAILTTAMLPSGIRSLSAHYSGDATYAPSNSTTPFVETVSAVASVGFRAPVTYATGGISARGVAVGDFNQDGKADLAVVTSTSLGILLGNGDGTFQAAAVNYSAGSNVTAIAVGDFNGDGKSDLALARPYASNVGIMLGNGDGTFQNAVSCGPVSSPFAITVADFDRDGILDLATTGSNASVLMGNGDGTFRAAVQYPVASSIDGALTPGDFNGDTKTDLAVSSSSGVSILPGNGDGTFQTAVFLSPSSSNSIVVGDFDGDGKADLAAGSYSSAIFVFLGKGDGSFQSPTVYSIAYSGQSVSAGDFNGDGIPDLVAASASSALQVLLGNGNGTFQPAVNIATAPQGFGRIAAGDFNRDGRTDITVIEYNNSLAVLLGGAVPDLSVGLSHGAGLTQGQIGAAYTVTLGNIGDAAAAGAIGVTVSLPLGLTATGISGTGWTCPFVSLTCVRSDGLAAGASYPPISVTVNVSGGASGYVTTTATVSSATGEVNTANNTASDTTFVRFAGTVNLTASPATAQLGSVVTLTATVAPSSATGKVTFYDGATVLGVSSLTGGQATLVTNLLPSGSRSLWAHYDGDSTYGPIASGVWTETITASAANGFLPSTSYKTGSSPQVIVVGDFNRDGKPDLVTTYAYSGSASGGISVFLGTGAGGFGPAVSYAATGSSYPAAVVVGDFNSDGNPDIVVADPYANSIYLFPGNGDGTFRAAVKMTGAYSVLLAADFDGDGYVDLAGLSGGSPVVVLSNGDGTFRSPVTVPGGSASFSTLAVGDLNGDGKPDLVGLTSSSGTVVTVLLGNGDGTFQAALSYPNSSIGGPELLVLGDFTGDGKQDVAIVYWVGVSVMPGNGDGTFNAAKQSTLSAVNGYVAAVGDFNGDGKSDIVYAGYYDSSIYLLFGKGDGTFQSGTKLRTDGYPSTCALADLNGDGRLDLAAANASTNSVNVFLSGQFSGLSISVAHAGNFTSGKTGVYQITVTNPMFTATSGTVSISDALPAGMTATSLSGAGWTCSVSALTCTRSDALFNAASYPPIVLNVNVSTGLLPSTVNDVASVVYGGVTNSATDPTRIVAPTAISLTATPGASILGQPVTLLATVSGGATGAVAFFDGASPLGSASLVGTQASLTTRSLAAGVHPLRATYAGDLTHAPSTSAITYQTVNAGQSSGLIAGNALVVGTGPRGLAMADLNGDGKNDLVTANSGSDTVSVLLGNGDGSFRAKVDYAVGSFPAAVATGDFNNDGKLDLAVADQNANNISILMGNGDGTFQAAAFYAAGNAPGDVTVSDFNGDGNADLLVSNSGSVTVGFLWGNGDGTFRTDTTLYYGTPAIVADFNRDGKPDFANGYSGLYVQLGNGDGTFQTYIFSSTVYGAAAYAARDLNGDGIPDLVAANPGYNNVAVSLGKGDGAFQTPVPYATGSSPTALAIADVNGDGKLDVVAANYGGSSISVLFGYGDGRLQTAITYTVGSQPRSVVAGDFNGDGRTDLAVVNTGSNTVSVLLGVLTPLVGVSPSHKGSFYLGQTGAMYTITVTNNGPGVTSGTVTVTDTLPASLTATAIGGSGWTCTLATLVCTRSDALVGATSYPPITVTVNVAAAAPASVTNSVSVSGGGSPSSSGSDVIILGQPPVALRFVPITPCRIADTRNTAGPFGGPRLGGGGSRDFAIPSSACGIPSSAQAYSLNVAVVPAGPLGYLTLWPSGQAQPLTSTLNSLDGRIKSNAAIVPAGAAGAVSVFASNPTDVILDINGYFVPATDPAGLAFYPIAPCRVADTRGATAPLGGPSLTGGHARSFPVRLAAQCNVPSTAQAYSLNFAAVPKGPLGYLTAWATGQSQPTVASLNAPTGTVTANAAIVPAGTSGSIDVFASNATDLVIDINGYFAPAGTGGLSLYNITPCRVLDTRQPSGSAALKGTVDVSITTAGCSIPAAAEAEVLSATVVPSGPLGYLTLWPQGQSQPTVATLNALDAAVTSNLAIVPTATGSVSAYTSNPSHLVLDIFGYFAP